MKQTFLGNGLLKSNGIMSSEISTSSQVITFVSISPNTQFSSGDVHLEDSDSLNNYKFRGYPLSTHNTATLNQYPSTSMGRYNDLDDDGMVPRVDIFQAELAP